MMLPGLLLVVITCLALLAAVDAKDHIRTRSLLDSKKPPINSEAEFEEEVKEKRAEAQKKHVKPLKKLLKPPTDEYHVFQISRTHVGSTLTINILAGLFDGRDAFRSYLGPGYTHDWHRQKGAPWNSASVTKSHKINISELEEHFGPNGINHQFQNLFFVGNIREEERKYLPTGYCDPDNEEYNWRVVCLEYNDLIYETMEELREVIHYVAESVKKIPYFSRVEFDEEEAVLRIIDYDEVKKKCSDREKKFGLGGGNSCSRHIKDPPDAGDP